MVKITGTTNCGGFEKECIKIGTICKVVDTCIDKRDGFTVGIEALNEFKPTRFWYLEKDVEKGHLEWIKE